MGSGSALTNPDTPARVALLVNGFCYRMSYVWARVALLVNDFCIRIAYARARVAPVSYTHLTLPTILRV